MTAYIYHLQYDFFNGLRDRSLLLMNYLFPLGLFVMMGALFTGINPEFSKTIIPAMIVIALMTSTLLGMPNPLVAAREAGVFRSYKINGVPAAAILSTPVLSSLLHAVLISAIITLAGVSLFNASLPVNWVAFVLVGFLATFAMSGFGILIGVVASNSRATILMSQLLFVPAMILSGITMPTSMLPITMQRIGLILPTTHVMNAWGALAFGQTAIIDPLWSVVILASGGLIAFILAVVLFRWDSHVQQRGRSPYLAVLAVVPYVLAAIFMR